MMIDTTGGSQTKAKNLMPSDDDEVIVEFACSNEAKSDI